MNDKIGRFGILTCNLIDPLYKLLDKICMTYNNNYNSVGLYYINDDGDYNISLFDLYDCHHIKWTTSHCMMQHFISSTYVTKINFYSLDRVEQNNFQSIYHTDVLRYGNHNDRSILEKKFIDIISGILISCNYERNYIYYLINFYKLINYYNLLYYLLKYIQKI